jgi:hypothetical protein
MTCLKALNIWSTRHHFWSEFQDTKHLSMNRVSFLFEVLFNNFLHSCRNVIFYIELAPGVLLNYKLRYTLEQTQKLFLIGIAFLPGFIIKKFIVGPLHLDKGLNQWGFDYSCPLNVTAIKFYLKKNYKTYFLRF